jgi:hypothetical protein
MLAGVTSATTSASLVPSSTMQACLWSRRLRIHRGSPRAPLTSIWTSTPVLPTLFQIKYAIRVTIRLEGSGYGGCGWLGLVRRCGTGGRQPKCGSAHDDMSGERVLIKARKRARLGHVGNEAKRKRFDKSCDDILESTRLYHQYGRDLVSTSDDSVQQLFPFD